MDKKQGRPTPKGRAPKAWLEGYGCCGQTGATTRRPCRVMKSAANFIRDVAASNSQRPAGISANGPFVTFRLTALAAAMAAAAFLVELLEQAAGVSSSRGNGASQEGQGNEG
jgi:hypothetical protein